MRSERSVEMAFQTKVTIKSKLAREGKKPCFSQEKGKFVEGCRNSNNKDIYKPSYSHCKWNNHKEVECRFEGKIPPPLNCRFHNKNGHMKKFCYRKQRQQNSTPHVQLSQQINFAEEENEEYLFITLMMDD